MANIKVLKDDGLALTIPGGSISAVLHVGEGVNAAHPNALCLIFSRFQGFSVFTLADPSTSIVAAIEQAMADKKETKKEKRKGKGYEPKEWTVIEHGDERGGVSFIEPGNVLGLEEINIDGAVFLKVSFRRHDGETSNIIASTAPGNYERLEADFEED